ncbi:MAG: hypothetical protein JO367_04610 [Actinobacteria bacterium]|nr:hypothetical protein [Actinomycetota bacterium]
MNVIFEPSLYVTLISAILTVELIKTIAGVAIRAGSEGAMSRRAGGRPAGDG